MDLEVEVVVLVLWGRWGQWDLWALWVQEDLVDQVDQGDLVVLGLGEEVGQDLDLRRLGLGVHLHLVQGDLGLAPGVPHHHLTQTGDLCLHHHLGWVDQWDLQECHLWDQWGQWDLWAHLDLGDQWADHLDMEVHQINNPTRINSKIHLEEWI